MTLRRIVFFRFLRDLWFGFYCVKERHCRNKQCKYCEFHTGIGY